MPTARLNKPLSGFKFRARTNQGDLDVGFQRITGVKESFEVMTYIEGDAALSPRKIPGKFDFTNVTLTRGLDLEGSLLKWFNAVKYAMAQVMTIDQVSKLPEGQKSHIVAFRREFEIWTVPKGEAIRGVKEPKAIRNGSSWVLFNSWPFSYEEGPFDAQSSDIVFLKSELTHEGISRSYIVNEKNVIRTE